MLPHFLEVFSLHLTTPTLILGMRVSCDARIGPATGTLILTFLRLHASLHVSEPHVLHLLAFYLLLMSVVDRRASRS